MKRNTYYLYKKTREYDCNVNQEYDSLVLLTRLEGTQQDADALLAAMNKMSTEPEVTFELDMEEDYVLRSV